MKHRHLRRPLVVATLLVTSLAACTTWTPAAQEPRAVVPEHERIRVTERSGVVHEIGAPRIEGDTLFGRTRDGNARVALTDIEELEIRVSSPTRTFIAVAGGVAGLLLAAIVVNCEVLDECG